MEKLNIKQSKNCKLCYKIKCKNCGWEANDIDVEMISKGNLKCCPTCGWTP